jgi:hypothetical protein
MRAARTLLAGLLIACVVLTTGATAALASTRTVGLDEATFTTPGWFTPSYTGVSAGLVLANTDALSLSSTAGTITSWKMATPVAGGTIRLVVLRPDGIGGWSIVGRSDPVAVASTGVNTYTTSLPIAAGDAIGVVGAGAGLGEQTPVVGRSSSVWFGASSMPGAIGSPAFSVADTAFGLMATVVEAGPDPQPAAPIHPVQPVALGATASVDGSSRSGTGEVDDRSRGNVVAPVGSNLVLRGANLHLATRVYFNNVPAAVWWIDGYEQLTAVVPRGLPAGPITVRIGGVAGVNEDTPGVRIVVRD